MVWAILLFIVAGIDLIASIANFVAGEGEKGVDAFLFSILFLSIGLRDYRDAKPQRVHFTEVTECRIDTVTTIQYGDTLKTYNVLVEGLLDRD